MTFYPPTPSGASGPAGGDLAGTYPNPSVALLDGSPVADVTPKRAHLRLEPSDIVTLANSSGASTLEIVAAPGTGKALVYLNGMASYPGGTRRYTGAGALATDVQLFYGDPIAVAANVADNPASCWAGIDPALVPLPPVNFQENVLPSPILANTALNVALFGGGLDADSGDSPLDVYVWYLVVDLPSVARPSFAITDADSSLQLFKVAGDQSYTFSTADPTTGHPFTVTLSTSNDGDYTPSDGGTRNITAVDTEAQTFTTTMSHTSLRLPPGTVFTVENSSLNDGPYTVDTADDLTGDIVVLEAIPDGTIDGDIILPPAVYLMGDDRTIVWVLGSAIADSSGDGVITL